MADIILHHYAASPFAEKVRVLEITLDKVHRLVLEQAEREKANASLPSDELGESIRI